jgi:hypothetical protein
MLWLIGIGGAWALSCVMAVALCVMARRGDEQLTVVLDRLPAPDVDFVATFAEPAPELDRGAAPVSPQGLRVP